MPERVGVVDATPVNVKTADAETPLVDAVAVRAPAAEGVAVVDAVPLEPVVVVALLKLRPVPVKLTVAPLTGFPPASFTSATSGKAKGVPTMALCPAPETTEIAAAVPTIVSVSVLLLPE